MMKPKLSNLLSENEAEEEDITIQSVKDSTLSNGTVQSALISLLSVVIAVIVGGLVILIIGYNPITAYKALI